MNLDSYMFPSYISIYGPIFQILALYIVCLLLIFSLNVYGQLCGVAF